jgi:hypothetical protein
MCPTGYAMKVLKLRMSLPWERRRMEKHDDVFFDEQLEMVTYEISFKPANFSLNYADLGNHTNLPTLNDTTKTLQ